MTVKWILLAAGRCIPIVDLVDVKLGRATDAAASSTLPPPDGSSDGRPSVELTRDLTEAIASGLLCHVVS